MNIAIFLGQSFDPEAGGVQRSTSKLAIIFKERNHNVIILSTQLDAKKEIIWHGIPIYSISEKNKKQLKEILEKENISIIINQAGYSYYLTKFIKQSKSNETKIINTLRINPLNFYNNHNFIISKYLKEKYLSILDMWLTHKIIITYHLFKQRFILKFIIKNVDAFVMLSERFKPELYKLAPGLRKFDNKIYGINNPFEKPDINISTIKKENIILHVGRLNIIQKRVDLLLQIWQKLHNKIPDWQFWVVGDGPEKEFMEKYCKQHSLINVKFFGKRNPDEFYKKAKIFHLTSAFEGFGNVLVEAQSYGCVPVLFITYSTAHDIVTHNENGILVNPFNMDLFVTETIDLINNPIKLSELGTNSFQSVDRFSYSITYKKWNNLFNKLKINRNY